MMDNLLCIFACKHCEMALEVVRKVAIHAPEMLALPVM